GELNSRPANDDRAPRSIRSVSATAAIRVLSAPDPETLQRSTRKSRSTYRARTTKGFVRRNRATKLRNAWPGYRSAAVAIPVPPRIAPRVACGAVLLRARTHSE